MPLVAYSDSEGSEDEAPVAPKTIVPKIKAQDGAGFTKSEPRKIKVDLPTLKPEAEETAPDRPAKRAKTSGASSGFNSLLPAPKKAAAQNAPARGVSLKTSSEAAFSRRQVAEDVHHDEDGYAGAPVVSDGVLGGGAAEKVQPEVKPVGKATKFKPLSVQGGQKKKKKPLQVHKAPSGDGGSEETSIGVVQPAAEQRDEVVKVPVAPPPKAKRSLFSVPQSEDTDTLPHTATSTYEAIITERTAISHDSNYDEQPAHQPSAHVHVNNLDALTSDLNLSATERRRLFGRHGETGDVSIAHFNMDAEYASNEQLRQAGEVVEHKAVKSIAPGKHSLQQLVNNARSQQDNLEDKWAAGRRERGEGQGKYGW